MAARMKLITISNRTRGMVVGSKIMRADTFLTRLVGLFGRRQLDAGGGLLIEPSSAIHTLGMPFSIDVVALDWERRVFALWPNLRPWRIIGVHWRMRAALELPAGAIERCSIEVGDQLEILDPSSSTECPHDR